MKKISNGMKLISLAIILAFVMPEVASAQGKANFSGTWTLNESKSTLPQGGGGGRYMGGGTMTVTQDASMLSRTITGRNGMERTLKYNLNGKESVNPMMGNNESKSVATWSPDGKTLTIKTTIEYNGNTRTSTAMWTLKDSKTLCIETTSTGRNGNERKVTMIYDKK